MASGEKVLHDGFFFEDFDRDDDWLKFLEKSDSPDIVPYSVFFAVADHKIVGMLNIRHR